jgi:restriction system protein
LDQRSREELLIQAVVTLDGETTEGAIVDAVSVPWFEIVKHMRRDPAFMYQVDWRKWEEILAGAYKMSGFDEVVLTPRSGDYGRDVIATKRGVLSVRIIGQMKKYKPGHLVTADEVRAMLGVAVADQSASKAVITTTSDFAPRVREDKLIAPYLPTRLELVAGDTLISWLDGLATSKKLRP